MIQTLELMVITGIIVALLLGLSVYYMQTYHAMATGKRVDLNFTKVELIRDDDGISLTLYVQSTSNIKVCITSIELDDLSTGQRVIFGDNGEIDKVSEVATLPFCINPNSVFQFSGYHNLNYGFAPDSKVEIKLFYFVGWTYEHTYNPKNPNYFIVFSTVRPMES